VEATRTCTVDGCDRIGRANRNMCHPHYRQFLATPGLKRPYYRFKDGRKTCSACGEDLPVEAFGKNAGKLRSACRSCHNSQQRERDQASPPLVRSLRRARLERGYVLTAVEYDLLLAEQEGRCAICRRPPEQAPGTPRLYVDHCHESGRVRGLLCNPCNRGMGVLGDDPARLRAAAAYLEERS
jgi:hypothetical protein